MATASEILELRENVDEPEDAEPYTDSAFSELIDAHGVTKSSEIIWTRKAAKYADLINVSEAGSSRSLGDLHKNALAMATKFASSASTATGPRVSVIERLYGDEVE